MTTLIDAIEHVTRDGERWDTLAWQYYGDPFAYGQIIAANPAADIKPTLPGGLVLLIPVLSLEAQDAQHAKENLPPWKR
ncbi:MAG: tail protein X [Burkholderia gladioli]